MRGAQTLYLVKRTPRPEYKIPWHQVIVCTRRHTAFWEAGNSSDRSWVWTHFYSSPSSGWFLERWSGLAARALR